MAYLLASILVLFCVSGIAFYRYQSGRRAHEEQRQRDAQANRVLKAEKRRADNGGRPLSG